MQKNKPAETVTEIKFTDYCTMFTITCTLKTTNLWMQTEAMILFKFSTFTFWVVKQKTIPDNKKTTKSKSTDNRYVLAEIFDSLLISINYHY